MATTQIPLTEHFATKADIAQLETRLIKWIIGAVAVSSIVSSTLTVLAQVLLLS